MEIVNRMCRNNIKMRYSLYIQNLMIHPERIIKLGHWMNEIGDGFKGLNTLKGGKNGVKKTCRGCTK
jgi:hypothetical protein